jgi:hypothetical protein
MQKIKIFLGAGMKSAKVIVASVVLVSSGVSQGEDAKTTDLTSVKVGVLDAKLGMDYRAEIERHDHGLMKKDNVNEKPTATSNLALRVAKLRLSGKLDQGIDFKLVFNMQKTGTNDGVENALFTYWLTDNLGFGMGKDKVKQGGFEMKQPAHEMFMYSAYKEASAPFYEYQPVAQLTAKMAGYWTLQVTEDVSKKKYSAAGVANPEARSSGQQPAAILEWMGDFYGVSPLIQVGAYDLGKSLYTNAGLKVSAGGFDGSADYMFDQRARYVAGEKLTDKLTTVAVSASYLIGPVRPFAKFTNFDVKQSDDKGSKDLSGNKKYLKVTKDDKGNIVTFSDADGNKNYEDNAQSWMVGTFIGERKKLYRPYIAYVSRSGKFYKSTTSDDTETKTESMVKVGLSGEF